MKGIPIPVYTGFQGKISKENGRTYYAQLRRNCTTVCCLAHPYTGEATASQLAAREAFKLASSMTSNALKNKPDSYRDGFLAQDKYTTYRDYVFSLMYADAIKSNP